MIELADYDASMFAPSDFFKIRADLTNPVPSPSTYASDLRFTWLREYDHLKIKLPSSNMPINLLTMIRQGFEQAANVPHSLSLKALDNWTTLQYEARGEKREQSIWASNAATGLKKGAGYAMYGIGHGLAGVLYEPYKGAKEKGIKGGLVGVGKGLCGLVYRPIRGGFFMLA